jgi:hypothetical protein
MNGHVLTPEERANLTPEQRHFLDHMSWSQYAQNFVAAGYQPSEADAAKWAAETLQDEHRDRMRDDATDYPDDDGDD